MNLKIVSGGQTGVDRAALDAALECRAEAGGWCPEGRKAEDGEIPERYPLKVLSNSGYLQRTRQNVVDSDGSLIIYFGILEGGTKKTVDFCLQERKPHLLIDAEELSIEQAAAKVREFIESSPVSVLNVAGPRASKEPRAYDYARAVVISLLQPESS